MTFYETFRATYRNRARFGLGAVPFRTSQMSQEWIGRGSFLRRNYTKYIAVECIQISILRHSGM